MSPVIPLLILAIPLGMFLLLGLTGHKMQHRWAGIAGTVGMGVTAVLAYYTAFTYFFSGDPAFVDADAHTRLQAVIFNHDWLAFTDKLVIRLGFLLDPISALLLVVITTISFMVHLYSNGYMRDHHGVWETGFQRFYAFLSLFSFSMLGLVVAGVYLVARLFPLYLMETAALDIIVVVGALTALYAAMVACTQIDIKRVLAFSTISQIAFMMVSLGVARPEFHHGLGYMAGMFHLFTHAMFKALLFLCAGALIHAIGSNDYTDMHGLRKHMPITHIAFLIGCLAIAGIIPFAGFFSKDEILTATMGHSIFWYIWMSLVAGLTAFYMFRLYYLIFWWKEHKVREGHHAPHDQPWTMTLPLIILSVVSVFAGFVPMGNLVTWNGHEMFSSVNFFTNLSALDWSVASISLAVAVLAIVLATVMYKKENPLPAKLKNAMPALWDWCHHRFYWDELYIFITHKIIFGCISKPIAWFDRHIIDGSMDGLATVTNKLSYAIRGLQSGKIQMYVWWYLIGVVLLGAVVMVCVL